MATYKVWMDSGDGGYEILLYEGDDQDEAHEVQNELQNALSSGSLTCYMSVKQQAQGRAGQQRGKEEEGDEPQQQQEQQQRRAAVRRGEVEPPQEEGEAGQGPGGKGQQSPARQPRKPLRPG